MAKLFIEFDQALSIRGQRAGSSQLVNVEGTVGRDGVALPFAAKDGEELEALVPWARIKQVVRARELKK
jgi:hypothetical protein